MGFTIALAILHLATLAFAAIRHDLAEAAFTLEQCLMGAAALALPSARRAVLDTLEKFWPAVLTYFAIVAMTAWDAGLLGHPASALKPYETRKEVWDLIGLFFGAVAVAGAAGYVGRRNVLNALLYAGLGFALLAAVQALQSGSAMYPHAGETTIVFALFVVLALFAAADEVRRRANAIVGVGQKRVSRVQRLVLPGIALLGALNGALIGATASAAAAMALGVFLLCAALAPRVRRRKAAIALLAVAATVAFFGGATLWAFSGEIDRGGAIASVQDALKVGAHAVGLGGSGLRNGVFGWPHEAGLLAFVLLGVTMILILAPLAVMKDRSRKPSRGFALALAGMGVIFMAGPGAGGAAATASLALLIGLAVSYADVLRPLPVAVSNGNGNGNGK